MASPQLRNQQLDHVLKRPRVDTWPMLNQSRSTSAIHLHLVRNGHRATGPSPPIDAFSAATRGVHRGMSLLVVVNASG